MKTLSILIIFFSLTGCYNRDRIVEKDKLLGKDYRLFQNTPVWDLAKATEDQDVFSIQNLVLEKKYPVNYPEPKFGNTLLMLAIENSDYKSVKALLDVGADPNVADNYRGSTPMHDAAKKKDPKYLKLLLEYKGNPNVIENNLPMENIETRETPLNVAISYPSGNNLEKVKLLVDAGANINFFNEHYTYLPHSPLSDAIIHKKFDIATYLLEQGACYDEIMYKTVEGDTIYILGALRRKVVDLNTIEYQQKRKIISFLKNKGLDYEKEPIPNFIERDIKKKHPNSWEEYIKKY